MHITARTRYALHAMAAMATIEPATISAPALATAENMSVGYLQTILGELRRARLIRSQRGHDGGYRLARPAAQITIGEVIRAMDPELVDPRDEPAADSQTAIRLERLWLAADTALRTVIDEVTLADVIADTPPATGAGRA